jgi:two-component system, chemotaxis family, response regulator Rcp1
MKDTKRVHVFLAEDNAADVWLVEEALKRQSLDYRLQHYWTAEDAITAAKACGSDGIPVPDVMLVDFNLPRGDGRDVLNAAASNPKLAAVPKVVMSSFLRPEEMEHALQMGARCFIPKPAGLDAFLTTVGVKVTELINPSAGDEAASNGKA